MSSRERCHVHLMECSFDCLTLRSSKIETCHGFHPEGKEDEFVKWGTQNLTRVQNECPCLFRIRVMPLEKRRTDIPKGAFASTVGAPMASATYSEAPERSMEESVQVSGAE
jgi:hypothetical protein